MLRILLDKELVTEATVDNLPSWRRSGFSAHGAVRVEGRKGAVRLGRYMIRCPIILKRLSWHADSGEAPTAPGPHAMAERMGARLVGDVLDFLARVVDRIPEPSQQMVRPGVVTR